MKGLDKIKFYDPKVVRKVQLKHLGMFKKRVAGQGRDKDGRRFPGYSQGYREALGRDMRIKRGPRKGQRHKGLEGISLTTGAQKIGSRQLRLRGITMGANFGAGKFAGDYYELTWDGEGAQIIEWQAEKGRDVINDIPDREWNKIVDMFAEYGVQAEFDKIPNKTVVRVG